MKLIVKRAEPAELTRWKALANPCWTPTYEDLRQPEKKAVKIKLMQEQGYLCCYCERRLTDDDSHIEHLKPQSHPNVDPLDYANLLCSCQKKLRKGEPRHCGNLKDDWYDEALLISPLQDGCEERFIFTGDGGVHPAPGDEAAQETIGRLGLDLPKLISLRKAALEPFLAEDLSTDELETFVEGVLRLDAEGSFTPFWTTIRAVVSPVTAAQ